MMCDLAAQRSISFLLAICAFCVFMLDSTSQSLPQQGQIHIRVVDPSGSPLRVRGELRKTDSSISYARYLRDASLFTVAQVPYGHYHLRVARDGFTERNVDFIVDSSRALDLEIQMTVAGTSTTVTVIGPTPLSTRDLPIADVPVPVQSITSQVIDETNAIDLTDALKRRLNGVYVNENQNNPFQPDVNYRGYTASPLVGSAEGLSVFMDGVRQNQPFGDVVAWDLIPKMSIHAVELIPGSNPLFGLNTLGGSLVVQTKSGLTDAGFRMQGYGGSFGRRALEAELGGSNQHGLNWFAAGTLFHEDGWRVQSPSSVRQSFTKLGYEGADTSIAVSAGYAINDLTGNGTQDVRAIRRTNGLNHGYASVYSIPDRTWQHSPFITVNATGRITTGLLLNGNAYFRSIRTNTTNGDINDDSFDQSLYTLSNADKAALMAAGIPYPATITPQNTPFPYLRCIAQGLELDEPGEKCTGVDTDTINRQHSYGLSGVLSWTTFHNRLSVGGAWDHGSLTFVQNAQYGYLDSDGLSITRIPVMLDGSTSADGDPQDNRVNLHGTTNTPSFFLTDTFTFGKWVLNAGGRYNRTTVDNFDRLPPVAYRGTLTATNVFKRFNPSAGIIYKATSLFHFYFDYSESSRAPTSTELGCADPDFPCSLPNALVSDPPLRQVISHTFESGVRGTVSDRLRWSAGFFHTENRDDLLFVASQQTGYGYFQNFGKTRRFGVEAEIARRGRHFDSGVEYTFLSATYQSSQVIAGGSNSSNSNALAGGRGIDDGGNIAISPENHIPLVPQHMFKLYADYRLSPHISLSADFNLIGASYVRGNENNLHHPDGLYYLGPGISPGYGVMNLGAHYSIKSHYTLFAQINNVLNRRYYTGGQLAATPYDDNGNFTPRPFASVQFQGDTEYPIRNSTFLSPGAPITIFGGLAFSFGHR